MTRRDRPNYLRLPLDDRQVMESIATAVIATDLDGTIFTFNKAAADMFGIPQEKAPGTKYYDNLAAEEEGRMSVVFNYVINTGRTYCGQDITFTMKDGRKVALNPHVSLIRDENRQGVGIVMVVEDVTEKRRMEKTLARKEKLIALGEMALGIAHEIRNPLSSIKGFATLIKNDIEPNCSSQRFLDIIIKESDRISRVSQELLNTARQPEVDKYVPININEIVYKAIEHFMMESLMLESFLHCQLQPGLPLILGEPERLQMVFSNLLHNAYQALGDDGYIFVTTELDGDYVAVHIRDTGIGMDQKVMNNIFDPFYTTKETGSGLGLAIVHNVISNHWGMVEVESNPGQGSTFIIRLPVKGRLRILE